MKKTLEQFKNGLFTQNPTLVLLLGMCPTLAVSTSLSNALGMGAAVTAVLICSNFAISLLRRLIPDKIRIAAFVVIIAGFVTAVDLLMQAYLPELSESLGVFLPLIVVNCIILARAEAFAFKNNAARSALDGLTMGMGFTLAVSIVSVIRESLGSGTLMGYAVFPEGFQPAMLLALTPGGFLVLGLVIAAMQKITGGKNAA